MRKRNKQLWFDNNSKKSFLIEEEIRTEFVNQEGDPDGYLPKKKRTRKIIHQVECKHDGAQIFNLNPYITGKLNHGQREKVEHWIATGQIEEYKESKDEKHVRKISPSLLEYIETKKSQASPKFNRLLQNSLHSKRNLEQLTITRQ